MKFSSALTFKSLTAVAALAGFAQFARAGVIPYPNPGNINPVIYTFTATTSGDVIGYFAGSGASYDEQVGMLVDGVLSANGLGLDDHSSSVGDSFDFGYANAGDTIVFEDYINSGSSTFYSDPTLNSDGANHVYSTSADAGQIGSIPAGTYVAFEDLSIPGSDLNYYDDTFVFTNVSTSVSGVPDAASTLPMLGFGLAALGAARRRFKSKR